MNVKHALRFWIAGCASIALATYVLAADWPQWRGLNRAAKAPDFKAPAQWPQEFTPKWKVTVGNGDATPSLVGDKLYVFTMQEGNEILRCLNAETGEELWQDKYPAQGATGPASGHAGPRSSPTVADGKVVTLGVRGMLSCLDAASGKVLWRKDEFKSWPGFFVSSSPIVVDGLCVAQVGGQNNGAVVAYDLASGEERWKWNGSPAYASPVVMEVDGAPLVVALASGKIAALAAKDGAVAWEASIGGGGGAGGRGPGGGGPGGFGRGGGERGRGGPDAPGGGRDGARGDEKERTGEQSKSGQVFFQQPQPEKQEPGAQGQPGQGQRGQGQRGQGGGRRGGRGGGGGGRDYLASTPVVDGKTIYYAAGGAIKAVQLEKDGEKVVAKELWSNPDANINFNSPVLKDGLLFGLNRNSQFFCVDATSGKTAWVGPRDKGGGYGSIVDAGSVLLAITPGSELVVMKPTAAEYSELARIKVSDTQTYAHLVVAGNSLRVKDEDSVARLTVE